MESDVNLGRQWVVLFFIMIFILGTQFVGLEAIITAVSDIYPATRNGIKRQLLLFTIVGGSFLIGITMCLDGGIYIFNLFDYYGGSGICLLWLCLCECIPVGRLYGGEKFWAGTISMVGYRPFPLFKYCWQFITPVMIGILYYFIFKDFKPFEYKNTRGTYVYPLWFESIGWCLASASILPTIIYALANMSAVLIGDPDKPLRQTAHQFNINYCLSVQTMKLFKALILAGTASAALAARPSTYFCIINPAACDTEAGSAIGSGFLEHDDEDLDEPILELVEENQSDEEEYKNQSNPKVASFWQTLLRELAESAMIVGHSALLVYLYRKVHRPAPAGDAAGEIRIDYRPANRVDDI